MNNVHNDYDDAYEYAGAIKVGKANRSNAHKKEQSQTKRKLNYARYAINTGDIDWDAFDID